MACKSKKDSTAEETKSRIKYIVTVNLPKDWNKELCTFALKDQTWRQGSQEPQEHDQEATATNGQFRRPKWTLPGSTTLCVFRKRDYLCTNVSKYLKREWGAWTIWNSGRVGEPHGSCSTAALLCSRGPVRRLPFLCGGCGWRRCKGPLC